MNSQIKGYYRYPTIYKDKVAFVADDDIWLVNSNGGVARRLTTNLGEVTHPLFSPDGKFIAFTGRDEGIPEIYIMPADGGPAKRLTYLGSDSIVVGWRENKIIFTTNFAQPFKRQLWLYEVDIDGNEPNKLPFGPAYSVSFGKKGVLIGRHTGDIARWKRYRGGTAGEIWIDENGTGEFHKLIDLKGNLTDPMWIDDRIYFISDHEGIGNIYSCLPNGEGLQKHTNHKEFYTRNASTDGERIVYHSGADIYILNPQKNDYAKVEIEYYSPMIQRSRRFVDTGKYLEDYALCKDGSSIAFVSRGKSFVMGNWEGSVVQQGIRNGVRYRLTRWLNDGKRVVLISDEDNYEHIEIYSVDDTNPIKKLLGLDIGRPTEMKVSPKNDEVVLTNHRNELVWVNLETAEIKKIDRSNHGLIGGFNWSPDGRWIAYSFAINHRVWIIKICSIETGEIYEVTEPVLQDFSPAFDPGGRYLYFLSCRIFNPVYDKLHFDLNFPRGMRPYLITLRKDVLSPFVQQPHPLDDAKKDSPSKTETKESSTSKTDNDNKSQEKDAKEKVNIDFDGIKDRVIPFPVDEGIYGSICASKDRVFYTGYPVEGSRNLSWIEKEPSYKSWINVFDLNKLEESVFIYGVTSFDLSGDGTAIVCRIGNKLRVLSTKREPKESLSSSTEANRKTGWINLYRARISIDPLLEWQQMFKEAWRLQRDYFWVEDMSGVDWQAVFDRYYPLVERVASRSEFSDLLWEMQGELGTSHAYELGGDYRKRPYYQIGFLGADLAYDSQYDAYRLNRIITGDVWDDRNFPPLMRPGVNLKEGMLILSINGEKVSKDSPPNKLLVNQSNQEVQLTVAESDGTSPRTVIVKTIGDETPLRYRDWIEQNRRYVHKVTNNRVGYIYIPNMMAEGYADFHRYFLAELDYEGLIVDVRFNGGGHVSSLLLEKLARKRLGYDLTRWMGYMPYPDESVRGPIVALTNENAGSDGDIFSHSFKLMKLGKLIGRRTWGGVIGIWPRNWLVDGTVTTQPEFSFWFTDVGWGVENYGAEPDIEVDITPQDYAKGIDTQLERAIEEILKEIEENPPLNPDFSNKPKRTLP